MPSTSIVLGVVVGVLAGALAYMGVKTWRDRRTSRAARARALEVERELIHLRQSFLRWRGEWLRTMLAQRWARNAACFGAGDPQRPILSGSAMALLLASSIEDVCLFAANVVVEAPKGLDGSNQPTAESQASETWRQVAVEGRDLAAGKLHTHMPEGQPQPPFDEQLWRFLSGYSPVQSDNWPAGELERARKELLSRTHSAAVDRAAERGHPRAVAIETHQ